MCMMSTPLTPSHVNTAEEPNPNGDLEAFQKYIYSKRTPLDMSLFDSRLYLKLKSIDSIAWPSQNRSAAGGAGSRPRRSGTNPANRGYPCQMTSMLPAHGIYFPEAQWVEVHAAIEQDLEALSEGRKWADTKCLPYCFSEHSHERVRVNMEFDFVMDRDTGMDLSDEAIVPYVRAAHLCTTRFFPGDEEIRCEILASRPKLKHGKPYRGVHLVYNRVVSIHDLGQIVYSAREVGLRGLMLDPEVLDLGPVKTTANYSHLRLPYTTKPVDCHKCRNLDMVREGCRECIGRGQLMENMPYEHVASMAWNGEICPPNRRRDTMIVPAHDDAVAANYRVPETDPVHYDASVSRTVKCSETGARVRIPGESRADAKRMGGSMKPLPQEYVEECLRILKTAATNMRPDWYADIGFKTPLVSANGKTLMVKAFGAGRNMCMHRNGGEGGKHKSNAIYFVLHREKCVLEQRCYDSSCRAYIAENRARVSALGGMLSAQTVNIAFGEVACASRSKFNASVILQHSEADRKNKAVALFRSTSGKAEKQEDDATRDSKDARVSTKKSLSVRDTGRPAPSQKRTAGRPAGASGAVTHRMRVPSKTDLAKKQFNARCDDFLNSLF